MTEIWKPIPGYEGFYEASSLGRIRSLDRDVVQAKAFGGVCVRHFKGKVLIPKTHGRYHQVNLAKSGVTRTVNLHSVICEAFHGPRPSPQHEAAHWDRDVANNAVDNLRWATKVENADDKQRHGTMMRGEGHAHAVFQDGQITEILGRFSDLTQGRTKKAPNGSIRKLAEEYGVTVSALENVIYGRSWKHMLEAR
jgi:hypothetical protein